MKNLALIFQILVFSFFLAACGGSEKEKSTEEKNSSEKSDENSSSEESSYKVSQAESAASKKLEARRKKGDTLAMPYKDLQKYLPKSVKGYDLDGEMKGQTMNMQGTSFSTAEAQYKKGDEEIEIVIIDYNNAYQMYTGLTSMWAMGMSVDNDDQKAGVITLKNNSIKGWENFNKGSKSAELLLGVSERFYITIKAEKQTDTNFIKSVAESLDLDKLAAL